MTKPEGSLSSKTGEINY